MRVRNNSLLNGVLRNSMGLRIDFTRVRNNSLLMVVVLVLVVAAACGGGNTDYVPKPKAYPKMSLPAKSYGLASPSDLPMSFEIPSYSQLVPDTNQGGVHTPGWYNLKFPNLDVTLHMTYYKFNEWNLFDSLMYDTRKLVNKHIQKADDIVERPTQFLNPSAKGLVFSIQGNTATNFNFYVTDSASHFLRGALYFNNHTESDSIAPVYQFVEADVLHLIKTLKWK